jgi:hypothetical protein
MSLPTESGEKCLVGWRGWDLAQPHFLTSSEGLGHTVWLPGERTEATTFLCVRRYNMHNNHEGIRKGDHTPPQVDCTCGIYAFSQSGFLEEGGYERQPILGEVWLWGRVIECEKGFRAQLAYPKKFYVVESTILAWGRDFIEYLAYRYGVEWCQLIDKEHPLLQPTQEADQEAKRRIE